MLNSTGAGSSKVHPGYWHTGYMGRVTKDVENYVCNKKGFLGTIVSNGGILFNFLSLSATPISDVPVMVRFNYRTYNYHSSHIFGIAVRRHICIPILVNK